MQVNKERKYVIRRLVILAVGIILLTVVILLAVKGVKAVASGVNRLRESSASKAASAAAASSSEESSEAEELSVEDTWKMKESATDASAWNLILVNDTYRADETYTPPLTFFEDTDFRVHPGIVAPLREMMDAAEKDGVILEIYASYRSYEVSQQVYDEKVDALLEEGYNQWDAPVRAGWEVPYPGASEHITGLAVDLVPRYEDYTMDETFAETKTAQWLKENAAEYGFIIRYEEDHVDHTGYEAEPWHLRYVGVSVAHSITIKGLCLEEYLGKVD